MLTMARMFMYVYMYIYIYTYTLCVYIYIYIYSISIYWRYFNLLRHCKKNICHDQVDLPAVPPARGLGTPILDLFILPSRILGWDNNYRNPNPNVKSLASSRSCRRILALLCFATFLGNNIRDQNATNGNDCFDLFDIPQPSIYGCAAPCSGGCFTHWKNLLEALFEGISAPSEHGVRVLPHHNGRFEGLQLFDVVCFFWILVLYLLKEWTYVWSNQCW